jgi:hypothetical protein
MNVTPTLTLTLTLTLALALTLTLALNPNQERVGEMHASYLAMRDDGPAVP